MGVDEQSKKKRGRVIIRGGSVIVRGGSVIVRGGSVIVRGGNVTIRRQKNVTSTKTT